MLVVVVVVVAVVEMVCSMAPIPCTGKVEYSRTSK